MKDTLVTAPTAILSKEKGFNENCGYFLDGNNEADSQQDYDCYKNENGYVTVPTQSLLQKWLWEKHKIIAYVVPQILFKELQFQSFKNINMPVTGSVGGYFFFKDWNSALEKALQEALMSIE